VANVNLMPPLNVLVANEMRLQKSSTNTLQTSSKREHITNRPSFDGLLFIGDNMEDVDQKIRRLQIFLGITNTIINVGSCIALVLLNTLLWFVMIDGVVNAFIVAISLCGSICVLFVILVFAQEKMGTKVEADFVAIGMTVWMVIASLWEAFLIKFDCLMAGRNFLEMVSNWVILIIFFAMCIIITAFTYDGCEPTWRVSEMKITESLPPEK
jgi:hypothetical protein